MRSAKPKVNAHKRIMVALHPRKERLLILTAKRSFDVQITISEHMEGSLGGMQGRMDGLKLVTSLTKVV